MEIIKSFKVNFKLFITFVSLVLFATFILGCNSSQVNNVWSTLDPLPLDPDIEAQIDEILPKLTLEQKVGQVIQGDTGSLTPEDVKKYRLGSVLSGGNSAPGPLPYAETKAWLEMADKYYNASIDDEGVEIAIPIIWGIDAVHGHANLKGAIIFPHNIGLGAMNNPDLIEEIASITAHELTVSGHDWTFAPTLAVPQDLRWGRAYEGFSEDPKIVNSYGDRIVIGLQGQFGSEDFMGDGRVISSAKHFLADGATENGVDQGDALINEKELSKVHAAGYYSSIPAGVQTVMASFSSWQGRKLHGDKELLTDVLKGKMGFNGFVVGDWNGHGQVPGCVNTDCPQSLNAGLDMYMAPDSWKGLYESTLKHVKDGTIAIERLDDAVRRILRVKLLSGIFKKGAPSTRANAGNENLLALPEHRVVARQAVRESMVLLKNNNQILPVDPSKTILVVGDGAASISKISGGWTLSWQGNNHTNDEFPNGESILEGIEEVINNAGGKLIFSKEGDTSIEADVVIAIYGEDPYAEFQGDLENLEFILNGFDTKITGSTNDYSKTANSDVVVITSGIPRKPGMTREELIGINAGIVKTVSENVLKHSPDTIIVVVSNPMDTMTYLTLKSTGLPKNRVIGMGGALDSSRFKTYLSLALDRPANDIHGMVIGGHGDTTMIPLTRLASYNGLPVSELISKNELEDVASKTMVGGATLTKLLGTSAWYAPGASVAFLVKSILNDEKRIIPCSVFLDGEYNQDDICIGVPCIIGKNGCEKIINLNLNDQEMVKFADSASAVRKMNLAL